MLIFEYNEGKFYTEVDNVLDEKNFTFKDFTREATMTSTLQEEFNVLEFTSSVMRRLMDNIIYWAKCLQLQDYKNMSGFFNFVKIISRAFSQL